MPDDEEVIEGFATKMEEAKLPESDGRPESENDPDHLDAGFEDPDFDAGAAVGEDTGR